MRVVIISLSCIEWKMEKSTIQVELVDRILLSK